MNSSQVYVIDTSYLLELFAVPGHSTKGATDEIRSRFTTAVENKARFYVTVPSIYELANHISHVSDGNKRRSLAKRVRDDVLSSLDLNQSTPWTIIPSQQLDTFKKLIVSFVDNHVIQRIGLSDSTLIDEAHRLKRDRYQRRGSPVHIWTTDKALKAWEPDNEPDAYLGEKNRDHWKPTNVISIYIKLWTTGKCPRLKLNAFLKLLKIRGLLDFVDLVMISIGKQRFALGFAIL